MTYNSIHIVAKEAVTIANGDDYITLDSVFQVPGMKKNLLTATSAVNTDHYVLFGPINVKFL